MTSDTLLYITVAALLVFWAVGAHNRLVRLKNAVGKAFAQVDAHLRQRHAYIEQLLQMEDTLGAAALAPLAEASRAVRAAMDTARQHPSGGAQATSLQQAEQHLDGQLAELWRSPHTQDMNRQHDALRQLVLDLGRHESHYELAGQPYHQAVADFNDAVQEFPAWMIAQLVGLKPLPGLHLERHGLAREAARPLMQRRESDQNAAAI